MYCIDFVQAGSFLSYLLCVKVTETNKECDVIQKC